MKNFRYELGHEHYKTLTVAELIGYLSALPQDMPVMATWEGVCAAVRPDRIAVVRGFDGGHKDDACDVLMLDVDQY